MSLAVNNEWVDGSPDIVDRRVANQFESAGVRIDFNFADMSPVGKTKLQDGFVACCLKRSAQLFRKALADCCSGRDLENSNRTIGAFDRVATAGEYDVIFGGFEHIGGDPFALFDNGVAGLAHDDAGEPHGAGRVRAATLLDDIGIVFKYEYVLERHAEPLRHALRKRRFVALSAGKRADYNVNATMRMHFDIGAFARIAAGRFQIAAQPDAAQSLAFTCCAAPPLEAVPIAEL